MSKSALVIGASRGIGLGLVRCFADRGWTVTGTVRNPAQEGALREAGASAQAVDIADADSVADFQRRLELRELDVLFVNAGVSGPKHQDAEQATADELGALMLTNATGPVRLARMLLDRIKQGGVLAFTTSAMGSVAENGSGDMELYRASKAALNSLTRSLVAKMNRPDLAVLSLHPGWVRTDMGGPNASLSVEESAEGMVSVVEERLGTGRCGFLDYAGKTIAW